MLSSWRVGVVAAVLSLALVCSASAAAAIAEGPTLAVPGLTAGPSITNAGLVWETQDAIMLTSATGVSSVLAGPGAPNPESVLDPAWFGQEWWVQARAAGVFAGRIGGALRELPLLRKCDPGSPTRAPAVAQYALAGERLFAALPAPCFSSRKAPRGAVLEIDLRTRRWHVLEPLTGTLDAIAASGRYVAVASTPAPARSNPDLVPTTPAAEPRAHVRVLDADTGATITRVGPPATLPFARNDVSAIQVDDRGDVLVTAGCCAASPGELAHVAQPAEISAWWWAPPGATVAREAQLGHDAVLSDGRVAYLSATPGTTAVQEIDVKDLLSGATSAVVAFFGTASSHGFTLSADTLAWAQQSSVIQVRSAPVNGGVETSCIPVALSPVELASVDVNDLASPPIVVNGAPIPPEYDHEPACIEM
jgi:hypothetical protein